MRIARLFLLPVLIALLSYEGFVERTAAQGPPITWNPSSVTKQAIIGTVSSVQISFTSKAGLSNVTVRVVPELAPFVSTSPTALASIPAGVPQSITLLFSVPKGAPARMLDGTIHLRSGNKTIARPLPVTLIMKQATVSEIPSDIALASPDRMVTSSQSEQVIFVKDEVNIFFQKGTPEAAVKGLVSQIGGVFLGSIPADNFYQVQVTQDGFANLSALIEQLKQEPNVSFALHHYLYPQTGIPLDPGSSQSYVLSVLNLPSAWDLTIGGHEIRVGVIDSAFAYSHRDFGNNIEKRRPNSGASQEHGTAVASIVGAEGNNGIDIAGVMWRTSLNLYSVGNPNNCPTGVSCLDGGLVQQALRQAIDEGQRVVNLSFAFECSPGGCTPEEVVTLNASNNLFRMYFTEEKGKNTLWVCSAGNKGINQEFASPASLSASLNNVVSVSAVDSQRKRAKFKDKESSNYGQSVTVAAPGVKVPALNHLGGYRDFDGTSAAAPYVTGVAGLILSINPCLSPAQLKSLIIVSADRPGNLDPENNEILVLNAHQAVQRACNLSCFDFAVERLEVDGNINGSGPPDGQADFKDEFDDGRLDVFPTSEIFSFSLIAESDGLLRLRSADGANTFTPGFLVDNCHLGLRDGSPFRLRDGGRNSVITATFRADVPGCRQAYGLQLFTLDTNELVNIQVGRGSAGVAITGLVRTASGTQTTTSVSVNLLRAQLLYLRLEFDDATNRVTQSYSTDGITFTPINLLQPGTVMTTGSKQGIVSVFGSVRTTL